MAKNGPRAARLRGVLIQSTCCTRDPFRLWVLVASSRFVLFLAGPFYLPISPDELLKESSLSRVHDAELSQPISTAIQIALIDLLRSLSIVPSLVIGHSSGEIDAA